jgi:glycosyltransferase involved in cell wall biosynthesis
VGNYKKIIIVQPYITKYRLPVFNELTDEFDVLIAASTNTSFGQISKEEIGNVNILELKETSFFNNKIFWQKGIIGAIVSNKPDYIYFSANPRYLSFWVAAFIANILRIKVIFHGQGLYNKLTPSIINKVTYFLFNYLCRVYICYTDSCKNSLKNLPIYNKCLVAENSIVNSAFNSVGSTSNNGILYIGRLREGTNIELLIKSITNIYKTENESIKLFVIGGGDLLSFYKNKYKNFDFIVFIGEVYDAEKITNISTKCFAGCYPGDAGLSVLHYMSLSLAPIAHSSLHLHMGPEPSYICDKSNGILFKRNSEKSLTKAILKLKHNPSLLSSVQKKAFESYKNLTNPTLGQRLKKIINQVK